MYILISSKKDLLRTVNEVSTFSSSAFKGFASKGTMHLLQQKARSEIIQVQGRNVRQTLVNVRLLLESKLDMLLTFSILNYTYLHLACQWPRI